MSVHVVSREDYQLRRAHSAKLGDHMNEAINHALRGMNLAANLDSVEDKADIHTAVSALEKVWNRNR